MKKFLCFVTGLILAFATCGCNKEPDALRVWLIQPTSLAAETEVRQLLRSYNASALISFVPSNEIDNRVAAAAKKGECPDVFMCFADSLPSFGDDKTAADLTARLSVSGIKSDEQLDSARRACLYQGKSYGVPLFCDVYMLATNRALIATPPQTGDELKEKADALAAQPMQDGENGVKAFEHLTAVKQSLLFESFLTADGGKMTDGGKYAFNTEKGSKALGECARYCGDSGKTDSIGDGTSAFSVMTLSERSEMTQKYPDAEITLSPLFGLNRLQVISLCMSNSGKDQKNAFKLLEFLYGKQDKLSAAYKYYPSVKDLTPMSAQDTDVVKYISQAKPSPDIKSYFSLVSVHLPSAIDKAVKGVDPSAALAEIEI